MNTLENRINSIESLEELALSELETVDGGRKNVWYYAAFALSWLTDMGGAEGDALMMSMH